MNVQVLGISVDHVPCLVAWAESLEGVTYPLLSDFWPHGAIAKKYGVFRKDGRSERVIFIIDTEGVVRRSATGFDPRSVPAMEALIEELLPAASEAKSKSKVEGKEAGKAEALGEG